MNETEQNKRCNYWRFLWILHQFISGKTSQILAKIMDWPQNMSYQFPELKWENKSGLTLVYVTCPQRLTCPEEMRTRLFWILYFVLPWRRTCLLRWNFRTNDSPHTPHENGLSPLCVRRCTFNVLESKNVKKQTLQVYGLSPACTRLCNTRPAFCLNDLLHRVHVCGRSPVCIVLCKLRLPMLAKVLLHSLHSYGLNPTCSSAVCLLRWYLRMKDLLHILHTCRCTKLFPGCFVLICLFRWPTQT